MNYIQLTPENLDSEHICCAISNNKDPQVMSKKAWLRDRLAEGLVFLKSAERGKCFIEYIPAEYAWVPIEAAGYMYIDCFWVSGSFKGHGYANELLDACIRDSRARGCKGLCILSSAKKQAFLSDPGYLAHRGFRVTDTAEPYFQLWTLPLDESAAELPRFRACAKHPQVEQAGFVLYYSGGCPYPAKYVPVLEKAAAAAGYPLTAIRIDTREKAQNAPAAWTNYALFCDGAYVTNEILSEKKFLALAEKWAGRRQNK